MIKTYTSLVMSCENKDLSKLTKKELQQHLEFHQQRSKRVIIGDFGIIMFHNPPYERERTGLLEKELATTKNELTNEEKTAL